MSCLQSPVNVKGYSLKPVQEFLVRAELRVESLSLDSWCKDPFLCQRELIFQLVNEGVSEVSEYLHSTWSVVHPRAEEQEDE